MLGKNNNNSKLPPTLAPDLELKKCLAGRKVGKPKKKKMMGSTQCAHACLLEYFGLIFTALWANSANDKIDDICLFPREQALTFLAN